MVAKDDYTYSTYIDHSLNRNAIESHLENFTHYFNGCRHVVDIGPGTGAFLKKLSDSGIAVTGLDNDPILVTQLGNKGFDIILGDASDIGQISIGERVFDGVFCSHVIEHMPIGKVQSMFSGLQNVLAPSAIVVFAFPNPESLEMQLFHFWKDPQHVRFYHARIVGDLLEYNGFEVIDTYSQGTWGPLETNTHRYESLRSPRNADGSSRSNLRNLLRAPGRWLKRYLGISRLEIEADYMRKLRSIGREAVVVARKRS